MKDTLEFPKLRIILCSQGVFFVYCYLDFWQESSGDLGRLIHVLVVCLYRDFELGILPNETFEWCDCNSSKSVALL